VTERQVTVSGPARPALPARPETYDAATRAALDHLDGQAAKAVADGRPANTRKGYAQDWASWSRSAAQVRGEHPSAIHIEGLGGEVVQAERFVRAHPVLDFGVIAVEGVEELRLVRAGDAPHPADVGGGDAVAPAGLLLEVGQLLDLSARGSDPANTAAAGAQAAGGACRRWRTRSLCCSTKAHDQ
jgi:hypothetical protein